MTTAITKIEDGEVTESVFETYVGQSGNICWCVNTIPICYIDVKTKKLTFPKFYPGTPQYLKELGIVVEETPINE